MMFEVFICAVLATIIFKVYLILSTRWNRSYTCLVGNTVIITGANTGLGYQTALKFAKRGARVILACRNIERANEAKNRIILETGNHNVLVKIIDMASLKSVRKFADDINKTERKLDILINNAGAGILGEKLTEDGLQLMMQVNYFGPFLLTNLLIGLLKTSAPSRVVNLSSILSHFGRFNPKYINAYSKGMLGLNKLLMYSNTKYCNVLFSNELARRLKGTGVTSNSLHPGVIRTAIFDTVPFFLKLVIDNSLQIFCQSVEEGVQTTIHVAVSDEVKNISGEYFSNCKVVKMAKGADDHEVMKKLWEQSARCVKLNPGEQQI